MSWYYIGPDKTGFDCSICCAGFYELGGSCVPFLCSTDGYPRSYVCPSTSFPSPRHVYAWLGGPNDDVTIEPNPVLCGNADACYTITGGPLNSAGRIGSGCNQTYVVSEYQCADETTYCPSPPPCPPPGELVEISGSIFYSCFRSGNSCSCYSTGSTPAVCNCLNNPGACECCDENGAPEGCSYNCVYEDLCPDGSIRYSNTCTGAVDPPSCPPAPCENTCPAPPGVPACEAAYGYSCDCGICNCIDTSVCICEPEGLSYDALTDTCVPCYAGDWEKEDCCDIVWKRKNCEEGKVCCNDGRCYDENTVLCVYPE
jgi:hypothetical protein